MFRTRLGPVVAMIVAALCTLAFVGCSQAVQKEGFVNQVAVMTYSTIEIPGYFDTSPGSTVNMIEIAENWNDFNRWDLTDHPFNIAEAIRNPFNQWENLNSEVIPLENFVGYVPGIDASPQVATSSMNNFASQTVTTTEENEVNAVFVNNMNSLMNQSNTGNTQEVVRILAFSWQSISLM